MQSVNDQELETFKATLSIADYATACGYAVRKDKCSAGSQWLFMQRDQDKIIINISGSEETFFDPETGTGIFGRSQTPGNLIHFVQRELRFAGQPSNLGHVRKHLRTFLRTTDPASLSVRHQYTPKRVSGVPDYAYYERVFSKGADPAACQYLQNRGISAKTLNAVSHCVRMGKGPHYNAAFAHYDATGRICGLEIANNGFKRNDGDKGLFIAGDALSPRQIVVCESGLDALSRMQLDGLPAGRAYVSSGGRGAGERMIETLIGLTHVRSLVANGQGQGTGVTIILGHDNDGDGDEEAETVRRKLRERGVNGGFVRERPIEKDWNDDLRSDKGLLRSATG